MVAKDPEGHFLFTFRLALLSYINIYNNNNYKDNDNYNNKSLCPMLLLRQKKDKKKASFCVFLWSFVSFFFIHTNISVQLRILQDIGSVDFVRLICLPY